MPIGADMLKKSEKKDEIDEKYIKILTLQLRKIDLVEKIEMFEKPDNGQVWIC